MPKKSDKKDMMHRNIHSLLCFLSTYTLVVTNLTVISEPGNVHSMETLNYKMTVSLFII